MSTDIGTDCGRNVRTLQNSSPGSIRHEFVLGVFDILLHTTKFGDFNVIKQYVVVTYLWGTSSSLIP